MTPAERLSPELQELIDHLLDGLIDEVEIRRLESLLLGNPPAQAYFRRYCQLHINLDTSTRIQRAIDGFRERRAAEAARATGRRSGSMVVDGAWSDPPTLRRFRGRGTLFCAAAIVLIMGGAVTWRAWFKPARETVRVQPLPPAPQPERLLLAEGEIQTRRLGDVGQMIVGGPADVELHGGTKAVLHRGRVRVLITAEAGKGFVVETPRGRIIDLGTEFGVDVGDDARTGVIVFKGKVELAVPQQGDPSQILTQQLEQGEGVVVDESGHLYRVYSIVTGNAKIFRRATEPYGNEPAPVILDVWDNIRVDDSRKLYEIVPDGMGEDAYCYVDRPEHDWNGMTSAGMPAYLVGADYVKTFCDDKIRKDLKIFVKLSRPARLFVIMDDRVQPTPDWLMRDFRDTGDDVGQDDGPYTVNNQLYPFKRGVGPGNSIDYRHSVWERVVDRAGVVELGPNLGASWSTGMYGIAAIPLEPGK